MPFRESILAVSPPFLTEEGGTAEAVQYTEGVVMDAVADWMTEAVAASMPGVGTPDALYLVGKDMQIDRGPNETDNHYIARLQGAVDSHRIRGNGGELLRQLLSWFSPSTVTPIRLVSNQAVWHEINLTTEVVTKTVVGTNWEWDALVATEAGRKRGWVIIDSSAGPWTIDIWGEPGDWGDGGTWGSDMGVAEFTPIKRIIDKWKPAHITCTCVIVTFDASLFERTDASPPNPDGDSDTSAWRAPLEAMFSGEIA